MERFLITHSLLSSWLFAITPTQYDSDRDAMADFMTVLRREPTETTKAMQDGIDFENLVTDIAEDRFVPEDYLEEGVNPVTGEAFEMYNFPKWYDSAKKIADIVKGGTFQYVAKRNAVIGGRNVLLYGRLDVLKSGHIFDIKFSRGYDVGHYYESTQHHMYFNLVPDALDFTYLVFNGSYVFPERYLRDETQPIEPIVNHFFDWLRAQGLDDVYRQYWLAR